MCYFGRSSCFLLFFVMDGCVCDASLASGMQKQGCVLFLFALKCNAIASIIPSQALRVYRSVQTRTVVDSDFVFCCCYFWWVSFVGFR